MNNFEMPIWSKHAASRSNQRGAQKDAIESVWLHADREQPCGSGSFILSISNRQRTALIHKGILPTKLAERAARLKLIINGNTLITVYKNDN